MKYYLILLLLVFSTVAQATSPLIGDQVKSPDRTKVWSMPAATDTLVGRASTDTLSNKTLVAPALGTPASGVATNLTGTAASLTAGNATLAATVTTNANLTGPVTSTGNGTAIANGAITQAMTGATATPAASTTAGWDASLNFSANNYLPGFLSTISSASPITLVVGSAQVQGITGSTAQQINLPVATTLGATYVWSTTIINQSSNTTTVKTSGGNTVQAMAANTQLVLTCINPSGGTGTASWNWTYGAIQAGLGGTGTVTSIATTAPLTGGSITTSGTIALGSIAGNTTILTAPTVSYATATGTGTGGFGSSLVGYVFTVSGLADVVSVGCVYTNNGHSFTVAYGVTSSATQIIMSGTSAPSAGAQTLTYSSGATSGNHCNKTTSAYGANITSSANVSYDNYTTPANVLWLEFDGVGGGAGGGGGGTGVGGGAGAAGSSGTFTLFGANIFLNNGVGAGLGLTPPLGGTPVVTASSAFLIQLLMNGGGGSAGSIGANATSPLGGNGGSTPLGQGGIGGDGNAIGVTGTGYGSGGAGGGATQAAGTYGGIGGSAGGYAKVVIIPTAAQTFPYVIGTGGGGNSGSTNGSAGAAGVGGYVYITEHYQ
jgi:hypothetical protein